MGRMDISLCIKVDKRTKEGKNSYRLIATTSSVLSTTIINYIAFFFLLLLLPSLRELIFPHLPLPGRVPPCADSLV